MSNYFVCLDGWVKTSLLTLHQYHYYLLLSSSLDSDSVSTVSVPSIPLPPRQSPRTYREGGAVLGRSLFLPLLIILIDLISMY